ARALEPPPPQRRQRDDDRLSMPVARHRRRIRPSEFTLSAAAVDRRVAVQDLAPFAAPGNAESMIVARHGGPVAGDDAGDAVPAPAAQAGQRALICVVTVDPREPARAPAELVPPSLRPVVSG